MSEIRSNEPLSTSKTKVEVIYAGGTISSLRGVGGYRVGGQAMDLLERLGNHLKDSRPEFIDKFSIGEPQIVYSGLSENIEEPDLERMDEAIERAMTHDPKSILMSFGTDFAEQAARRFQRKHKGLLQKKRAKIVIVTANDDFETPGTDAWDNLTFSLTSCAGEADPDVYIGFHSRLVPAHLAVKEPFNGVEMNVRAIDDPEYLKALELQKSRNQSLVDAIRTNVSAISNDQLVIDYPVNVFRQNHEQLLQKLLQQNKAKTVLLTLYHSGTANTNQSPASVVKLVEELRGQNLTVFGATENDEPTDLHKYETSVKLLQAGVVPLYNMPRGVALEKLRLVASDDPIATINAMLKNVAGEIDEDSINTKDIEELKKKYS